MIERMPENKSTITKRATFMRNKLLPAAVLGLAALLGIGCGNGTTDQKCDCPTGTVREYADSPACCEGEDCTCGVKQTYSHTFGSRTVAINAPTGGLTEAQVAGIKSMLDTLAADTGAAATWLKGQTGTLSVVIGSGYGCTATTLTIPANFASDASLDASVKAAVESAVPCPCPAGTMREFSDSPACCTSGDCTCDVKTTHELLLGSRPVTFNVLDGGITEAQKDAFQTKLTDAFSTLSSAATGGDPNAAAFIARTSIPLIISVQEESFPAPGYYRSDGTDSLSIGEDFFDPESTQSLFVILYAFSIEHNSDYTAQIFDTSKETIRLAYAPFDEADIELFVKDVLSQVSQLRINNRERTGDSHLFSG